MNKPHSTTRRSFLAASAVGLGALIPYQVSSAQDKSDPYKGLKVGVHSYTLRKLSFEDTVRVTKDSGVRHIGFNPVHIALNSPAAELQKAREHVENAGLTIMACGVIGFTKDAVKARQAFDFARAMGMPVIAANPEKDSLSLLDGLVEEYGIRIAIHNHGPDSLYSTPDDVLSAIKGHHEYIGACADLGHYERADVRAADALRALGSRVYDMHLKDVDRPVKEGKSVVLGTGIVDLGAVFEILLETKFARHVALEYESNPDDPLPGMNQSFAYVRKLLAG